ncbi:MAG: coproporphyrinogen III oxidase family protein [Flavobacterium sp.]|nr:MAG: coproporphyrinogen III oxidase family protein [Flavobacterium sp.]
MLGIYIHIPFCKQACHYCDFHFSTSLKKRDEMVEAICEELRIRKSEIKGKVETIYFGGGTPSLLSNDELEQIFEAINEHYLLAEDPEITLEANPDDLTSLRIQELVRSPVNRLSIGIQSFFKEDLELMNRAHTAVEAMDCITEVKKHFTNYSIDLIYGIPGMTEYRWKSNLNTAFNLDIPHLSCYALTVEPKTALKAMIAKGIVAAVDDEMAQLHHAILLDTTEALGYENYEFSNFGKPGYYSKNNMAYWHGRSYLGIGPSAHSYDGKVRSWNVANNNLYLKSIQLGELPLDREELTMKDRYNEYVMTRLRTAGGIVIQEVEKNFGERYKNYLLKQVELHLANKLLLMDEEVIRVSRQGKFLSDGIAADLFLVNL